MLGSPTEQTPVFAAVGCVAPTAALAAWPATAAAATSVLVLARLRRRFTRLDHTRRPSYERLVRPVSTVAGRLLCGGAKPETVSQRHSKIQRTQ